MRVHVFSACAHTSSQQESLVYAPEVGRRPSRVRAARLPLWQRWKGREAARPPMTRSFPLAESWVPASCREGT